MGGDLVLKTDSNGMYLHHTNYRDTLGIPAYPTATLDIYIWDATTSSWLQLVVAYPMPQVSPSGTLLTGVPYGVEVYNYDTPPGMLDSTLFSSGSGTYRCVVYDCCRNAIIGNMTSPSGESLVLSCEFNYDATGTVLDQTPEFLNIPVIYGPINSAWAYNPLPYDADGDSLSWEIYTPIGGVVAGNLISCAGYTLPPATATGGLTLNPITGEFTWTPSMLGNYVASFKIHEYRGGVEIGSVIRDMQYIVIPDSSGGNLLRMPEFAMGTPYLTNTADDYNYVYYTPNVPFTFDILASDPNSADIVTLQANSELFKPGVSNASFNSYTTGFGNQVQGTFKWTPAVTESRDKLLAIRANDGTFTKDFTILLRKASPTSVTNKNSNDFEMNLFPNPIADNTIRMNVKSDQAYKHVTLQVVDMTGKKVAKFNDIQIIAGQTFVQRNLNLPKGIYTIQLTSNNKVLGNSKLTKL